MLSTFYVFLFNCNQIKYKRDKKIKLCVRKKGIKYSGIISNTLLQETNESKLTNPS